MSTAPWYDIAGSNGDEAEAQGIAAAELAARTFVLEDGNDSAEIKLGDRVVSSCKLDEHESLAWSYMGRRRDLR